MNLSPPSISLSSQQLTPARVAWVMDAGHSTVEEWLGKGELGHFKKGRLVRIPPEELLRFIVRHTVKRRGAGSEMLGVQLAPDEFERLWGKIEKLVRTEIFATKEHKEDREVLPAEITTKYTEDTKTERKAA